MNEILEKSYSILVDLFEVEDVETEKVKSLRNAFCSEMASVIVSLKEHDKLLVRGLNIVFLPEVKEGNFSRAFQVFKFLEDIEI